MNHTEERLQDRHIGLTPAQVIGYVYEYGKENTDIAVIVAKCEFCGQAEGAYRSRGESNGDMIVLIIRNMQAKTIMYRRSNQNNTPQGLRVSELIDLTQ